MDSSTTLKKYKSSIENGETSCSKLLQNIFQVYFSLYNQRKHLLVRSTIKNGSQFSTFPGRIENCSGSVLGKGRTPLRIETFSLFRTGRVARSSRRNVSMVQSSRNTRYNVNGNE